jgi:hypothetical protein
MALRLPAITELSTANQNPLLNDEVFQNVTKHERYHIFVGLMETYMSVVEIAAMLWESSKPSYEAGWAKEVMEEYEKTILFKRISDRAL